MFVATLHHQQVVTQLLMFDDLSFGTLSQSDTHVIANKRSITEQHTSTRTFVVHLLIKRTS